MWKQETKNGGEKGQKRKRLWWRKELNVKAIGSAVGALALVFALVALTTNSWWQTEQIKHGLWSANINDEVEKIFIGDARGYRGLETVRGFCIISVLVLVSGFITSVVSLIPKWSDQMSPQVGVWTYTTSAIFISKPNNQVSLTYFKSFCNWRRLNNWPGIEPKDRRSRLQLWLQLCPVPCQLDFVIHFSRRLLCCIGWRRRVTWLYSVWTHVWIKQNCQCHSDLFCCFFSFGQSIWSFFLIVSLIISWLSCNWEKINV